MKVNDLNPYPMGAPPVTPPAGQTFQDPIFNTTILRVTDEKDSAGVMFANNYSAIYDLFNRDSTRIIYLGLNGLNWSAQLDIPNRAVSNKKNVAKNGTMYWSRLNPNFLYVIEGWNAANLWKYDFAADSWTLLADLSKLLPATNNLPNTTWAGSRGMSWDDNRFHIIAANINSCYVYDLGQAKLIGPFTLGQALASGWAPDPASAAYLFNKSGMDSAGKSAWSADIQLIFDIETGATFLPKFGTPDNQYGDVHADCGRGNVIVACGGVAKPGPDDGFYPVVMRLDPNNLSTYLAPRTIIGPRFLWGLDSHTSFRDASGQWANFDLDGTVIGADAGKTPIFGNQEMFQFSLSSPPDGSINRRIAHAYSDPSSFTDPNLQYWANPHVSQAQDNRAVGYNSTYGNKRIDVFVAFLDEPVQPPPPSDTLAGVEFSHEEALALKASAQWILSQKKG